MNETKKILAIKDSRLFGTVYRRGACYPGKYTVLYVLPCRGGRSHLGITVSKDRGCAVVRNRIKRVIREAYRQNYDFIKGNYNFVIVARQACAFADSTAVAAELHELLTKAALL